MSIGDEYGIGWKQDKEDRLRRQDGLRPQDIRILQSYFPLRHCVFPSLRLITAKSFLCKPFAQLLNAETGRRNDAEEIRKRKYFIL